MDIVWTFIGNTIDFDIVLKLGIYFHALENVYQISGFWQNPYHIIRKSVAQKTFPYYEFAILF